MPTLGLQLWSLRKETERDAEGALRRVRDLGFDAVELAGDYGWSAEKWARLLAESGLTVSGAHLGYDQFVEDPAKLAEFHRAIGNSRYIVPSLPGELRNADGYRRAAATLNRAAEALAPLGGQVLYHNHDFEFADLGGTNGFEILVAETDPEKVRFEVDAYWVEKGGFDAYQFVVAHASRVGALHAKELRRSDRTEVPVGAGDINFPSLLSLAKANEWPVVLEYEGANAVEAVRQGAAHLRGILEKMR